MLLSELAGRYPSRICFDLGTGTGEVLNNTDFEDRDTFAVGLDVSMQALSMFSVSCAQPVLCPVELVSSVFRRGCADLVLANPPYNSVNSGRLSPDMYRREARSGDQLLVYRFVFAGAHLLRPGGCMIITGRSEKIPAMEQAFRAAGFCDLTNVKRGRVAAVTGLMQLS